MVLKELFYRLLNSLVLAAATIGFIVYGMRIDSVSIEAFGIVILYLGVNSFVRVQSLFCILILVLLAYSLGIPLQITEIFRVCVFAVCLAIFVNGNANRSPFSCLALLWFLYLAFHLLPLSELNSAIVGVSPIPTSKTLHIMFSELFGIALLGLAPSSRRVRKLFGSEPQPLTLAKLLTHSIAVPMTLLLFVVFKLLSANSFKQANELLTEMPYFSSMFLLVTALTLVVFRVTIRKVSSELKNIFRHLEICATPDSTFLALSKKPPLPLVEYEQVSSVLRHRAQSIVAARRKSAEIQIEVNNLKRTLIDENSHASDLHAIAHASDIGYLAINLDGIVTFANSSFCEMFAARWEFNDFMQYSELISGKTEWGRHLHFVLDWSISNFETLGDARDCPFTPREDGGRSFDIVTKSYCHVSDNDQSNDFGQERIFLYVKELPSTESVSQNENTNNEFSV